MEKKAPVALVTGSTGLIGREVCRCLIRSGMAVAGGYFNNTEVAASLNSELRAIGHFVSFAADLAKPDEGPAKLYKSAAESIGEPDILIICSGLKLRAPALMTKPKEIAKLMAVNFESAVELTRLALRPMMRREWGRVVLVGSRAGTAGFPGQAAYAASKAALSIWAASVANEVGSRGVTVNVVAPGAIKERDDHSIYSAAEAEKVTQFIGCRRLGDPQELVGTIEFLCSDRASYINGATLAVDGAARF